MLKGIWTRGKDKVSQRPNKLNKWLIINNKALRKSFPPWFLDSTNSLEILWITARMQKPSNLMRQWVLKMISIFIILKFSKRWSMRANGNRRWIKWSEKIGSFKEWFACKWGNSNKKLFKWKFKFTGWNQRKAIHIDGSSIFKSVSGASAAYLHIVFWHKSVVAFQSVT